jgi:hypothetical protein
MKKLLSRVPVFTAFCGLSCSIFALADNSSIDTFKDLVTQNTNGVIGKAANSADTANTTYNVNCYVNLTKGELRGSMLVGFNNVQNTLDSEHLSFTQTNIPAMKASGQDMYGYTISVNGTQLDTRRPYLLTCNISQ